MNVRELAWKTLCQCEKAGQYSNLALNGVLKRNEMSAADRSLLTALIYGCIERQVTLDAWIEALANRGIEPEIRVLLRMGLYQLAFLDRIPDHAAVNETVLLAPRRAAGFINAVLRSFLRCEKRIEPPSRENDPIGFLSVTSSVVRPLAEKMIRVFGMERAEKILRACGEKPPICLRVNPLKTTREQLAAELSNAGYDPEPFGRAGLRLRGNAPISALPKFGEGWFFVQDEASQRCVEALDAHAGMTVIDVCASPGSKSFGAAMKMNNEGRVLAYDLHRSKLSLVENGAKRLGIEILTVAERDARNPLPDWEGRADRVICDVPCSGYGVIAKKPELRLKDPAASAGLPQIQQTILARSATLPKRGGKIVYSTCTLLPEENGDVVDAFLASHPDFVEIERVSLYPDTDGTDGFFYAVLQRN